MVALAQNVWDSLHMSKEGSYVRDELARERTALANQRTLLAYGRTALGLVALAVLVFKFGSSDIALILGPLSLTAALFVMLWGLWSFRGASERLSGKSRRKWGLSHKFSILRRFSFALRRHREDHR